MKKMVLFIVIVIVLVSAALLMQPKNSNDIDDAYYAKRSDPVAGQVTGYNGAGTPGDFDLDFSEYQVGDAAYIKILVNAKDEVLYVEAIKMDDIKGSGVRMKLGLSE